MEKIERPNLTRVFLMLPRTLLQLLGRTIKGSLMVLGVLVVLGVAGYVEFESIIEALDSRYSQQIDAYLGTDTNAIARLHDPAYFAAQSAIVSEDLKVVAWKASAERRMTRPCAGILDP